MHSKLVYTVPNVGACERVIEVLREQGVSDDAISVVGNSDKGASNSFDVGTSRSASASELLRYGTSEGTRGVLAGLSTITVAPHMMVAGAAIASVASRGAFAGVVDAVLAGNTASNNCFANFEESIRLGWLLLAVDVDDNNRLSIQTRLLEDFPEIVSEGEVDSAEPIV